MYIGFHVKGLLLFFDFNKSVIFFTGVCKMSK